LREIRFGLVIPQGWSYDFVFNKEVEKQEENHNPINSMNIQRQLQKQLINLNLNQYILMTIFFHIMHQIARKASLNVLPYYHL
jgi:hypothetical protein